MFWEGGVTSATRTSCGRCQDHRERGMEPLVSTKMSNLSLENIKNKLEIQIPNTNTKIQKTNITWG